MALSYRNRSELVNETFLLLEGYYLFVYTSWTQSAQVRYDLGFVQLFATPCLILFNLTIIVYEVYKHF